MRFARAEQLRWKIVIHGVPLIQLTSYSSGTGLSRSLSKDCSNRLLLPGDHRQAVLRHRWRAAVLSPAQSRRVICEAQSSERNAFLAAL